RRSFAGTSRRARQSRRRLSRHYDWPRGLRDGGSSSGSRGAGASGGFLFGQKRIDGLAKIADLFGEGTGDDDLTRIDGVKQGGGSLKDRCALQYGRGPQGGRLLSLSPISGGALGFGLALRLQLGLLPRQFGALGCEPRVLS